MELIQNTDVAVVTPFDTQVVYKISNDTVAADFDVSVPDLSLQDFYAYFNNYAVFLLTTTYKHQFQHLDGMSRCFAAALFYLLHHKKMSEKEAVEALNIQLERQKQYDLAAKVHCKACRTVLFTRSDAVEHDAPDLAPQQEKTKEYTAKAFLERISKIEKVSQNTNNDHFYSAITVFHRHRQFDISMADSIKNTKALQEEKRQIEKNKETFLKSKKEAQKAISDLIQQIGRVASCDVEDQLDICMNQAKEVQKTNEALLASLETMKSLVKKALPSKRQRKKERRQAAQQSAKCRGSQHSGTGYYVSRHPRPHSHEQHKSLIMSSTKSQNSNDRKQENIEIERKCNAFYFDEPLPWMGDTEGKLHCPKCSVKVGYFQWSSVQCGCGTWVPGIRIVKSRVDCISSDKIIKSNKQALIQA